MLKRGRKETGRTVLHEFLASKREEIIARTRIKVAARSMACATEPELAHGVPLFLEQLIEALKHSDRKRDEMNASAMKHGNEMQRMGFTAAQVVYDYGNICQVVTELASELNAPIALNEFHALSTCLHEVIALAVTEYAQLREETASAQETERIGALAREMHDQLGAAILSLGMIKEGEVSLGGSTGAILDSSLKGLNDLIDRSLAEVPREPPKKRDMADRRGIERKGKASILVVDRDPHVRELESHFLHQAGYSVEFEKDGDGAFEQAWKLVPDIVITEILVPKLDGLALCRRLKADSRTRGIAVLVFSMLAASGRALEAGADGFLLKPLAEHTLVGTVGHLLETRTARMGRAQDERWS